MIAAATASASASAGASAGASASSTDATLEVDAIALNSPMRLPATRKSTTPPPSFHGHLEVAAGSGARTSPLGQPPFAALLATASPPSPPSPSPSLPVAHQLAAPVVPAASQPALPAAPVPQPQPQAAVTAEVGTLTEDTPRPAVANAATQGPGMDEIAAECAALRMQAALAEERASAMQVVMAEQESAIAEGASALGDEALGEDAGAEGAARSTASFALSQLLQRWRYKVFDLLMQSSHAEQQSTAALQRKEAHVATLNQRLASQQVEIEALQLQLHQSAIAASQQVRCVGVLTHSHTPPSIRRPTPLHTFLLAPHANETSHRAFPPMCSHHTLTHPPSPRIYVQRAIANDAEIARSAERELHRVQYEHREAKLMRERRARQIVESTVRSCVANASTRVEGTHDSLQQGLSRLEAYALRLEFASQRLRCASTLSGADGANAAASDAATGTMTQSPLRDGDPLRTELAQLNRERNALAHRVRESEARLRGALR